MYKLYEPLCLRNMSKVALFIYKFIQGGGTMAKIEPKKLVVNEIKGKLEGASSIALVDYRGLSVDEDTILRRKLREANVEYRVYKNTMMNFAVQGTEFEPIAKHLAGPSAIVISYEDPTSGPRVIAEALKTSPALEFKGGVVEGKYFDDAGMKAIGDIPPRDELLSRLLGSFKSPIASFARVVKAVAEKSGEEVAVEETTTEEA